jgi:proto-oncogene tyrosine-protein kinase Met
LPQKVFKFRCFLFNKASIFDSQNITLILKEALLMNELNHCNVLKLRGISFDTDYSPLVLSPYMKNGDLLTYIRDTKNLLPIKDLLNFAFQIAKG